MSIINSYCFFFQAEDGIRDRNVTGVQTCALPICGTSIQETAVEHFCFRVRGANHDHRLPRCEPVEGDRRHLDNSDLSLAELPRCTRTLTEEPPRISLQDIRHRFHSPLHFPRHYHSSCAG